MPDLLPALGALSIGSLALGGYATLYRNSSIFGAVLAQLPGDEARVALTFDDGPNPEATPRLLDVLAEEESLATFFLLGSHVARWPEMARRIVEEGHLVANHGFSHQRMDFAGPRRARADISAGARAIADATGAQVSHFRAPHGARSPFVTPVATSLGQRTVGWSVSSKDHANHAAAHIAHRVNAKARPGSIILLHDGDAYDPHGSRLESVAAIARIIPALRARSLSFALLPL